MLKKTITYEDYNGVERTEDFYFNLSKSEILNWQLGVAGGLTELLTKIINAKDIPDLVEHFQELILKAYGEKSQDGRQFIKSPELSQKFKQCPAYDILYMSFIEDADIAAEFVKGVMPSELAKLIEEEESGVSNKQELIEKFKNRTSSES